MGVKDKTQQQIEDLQDKIIRQDRALSSYREELKKISQYKLERELYSDLLSVFAMPDKFDDVLNKMMEIVSKYFGAWYHGVFWLDDSGSMFQYRMGKGYKPGLMSGIPYDGSLMGDCLFRREVVWSPDFQNVKPVIHLNQEPPEYNVLCAPLVLLGEESGVIRFANIDSSSIETGIKTLNAINSLLSSNLERMILKEKNERTLKGLETSFSIARLLEDTLNTGEILKRVCFEVPRLFKCVGCIIAMVGRDRSVRPALSYPEGYIIGGNPGSSVIYLRNLLEAFPDGSALITNVYSGSDRRWSWPNAKIKSLCMAPLRIRNDLKGIIVATGPADDTYDSYHSNLLGLAAAQASITLERASYFRQQEDMARLDGLTGLYNHRVFQERVREEINRAFRYSRPLSMLMLDIDHFKKFNDTHGHPVGDEVIKMVSRTMKGLIRSVDQAFRYGGEEFCLLLPETSCDNAVNVAERLRKKIEANRTVKGLTVTVSIGITELKRDESAEDFIKRVDEALYKAKEEGRNRVVVK